tara:strand:- start:326 stop:589 length:264 start_codon:yes stop_codon:yes gene_type:complete
MADMTRPHYQLVADVILKAKLEVEAQKNIWAKERGGEHEMTSLQYASHLSASLAIEKLGESLKKAFREAYDNFNETKFNQAIDARSL